MIKNLTLKIAELGKIKIGGVGKKRKSKAGNDYYEPEKWDHFQITKTTRNDDGKLEVDIELMNALQELVDTKDGQLRQIPILLHSDDIDEIFLTRYALYEGKKCICSGDGESARQMIRKVDPKTKKKTPTGKFKNVQCPCPQLENKKCKPNGKFHCSINAPGASIAGAVHIWRTTSIISIEQMMGSLVQIHSVCGFLKGVPLWLKIKPIKVEPDGKPITVYVCHVELRESDITKLQERAIDQGKLRIQLGTPSHYYSKILSLPGHAETEEEQAEIEAEFYAEDTDPEPTPEKKKKGSSPSDIGKALKQKAEETKPEPETTDDNSSEEPY